MKRNYEEWMSNRDKTLLPRKTKFWCSGCDGNLVPPWHKCEVCGHRNGRKRFKK